MPRIVLPRVDFPQPLSPTSPKVSPGCTVKSTPSTALSQPVTRLGKPRVRGKCFFRPCTSRIASMFLLSGEEVTTHPMIGKNLQSRRLDLPTHRQNELTAGVKTAALGRLDEMRDDAGNAADLALLTVR